VHAGRLTGGVRLRLCDNDKGQRRAEGVGDLRIEGAVCEPALHRLATDLAATAAKALGLLLQESVLSLPLRGGGRRHDGAS